MALTSTYLPVNKYRTELLAVSTLQTDPGNYARDNDTA